MADHQHTHNLDYKFSVVTDPASSTDPYPIATAINDRGEIVGGNFIDNQGTFSGIAIPDAVAHALDVNNLGQIVGDFGKSAGGFAFIDTDGTITYLNLPAAAVENAELTGINDRGQAVGQWIDRSITGAPTIVSEFGFIDNNGTITHLQLSDGTGFMPNGINDADQVVGTTVTGQAGVLDLKSDSFTPVSIPGATSTVVSAINNRGQVAGWFTDSSGATLGFIDTDGRIGTIDLPASVGTLTAITSINDLGQLVGTFITDGTTESFVATPAYSTEFPFGRLPQAPEDHGRTHHAMGAAPWHDSTTPPHVPPRFGDT